MTGMASAMPRLSDDGGMEVEIISTDEEAGPSSSAPRPGQPPASGHRRRRPIPVRLRQRSSNAGEVIDLTSESPEAVARDAGDEEVVFVSARQPAKRRRLLPAVKTPGSKGGVVPQLPTPPPNHSYKCPVCLETCRSMTSTTCGHVFCEECIRMAIRTQKKCPTCRKNLTARQLHRIYLS
mmetsp:Transcript_40993/g.103087  ORF Transcript_40993/g.103087 Transcript_40993/m.103087 type:complete len:180 (+) Transcript_40993:141-680(+)